MTSFFFPGKSFNLTITVHTNPLMVTVYTKCIKVVIMKYLMVVFGRSDGLMSKSSKALLLALKKFCR